MKVKYEFSNETLEIEVAEEWGHLLKDLDRQEYNSNQKETRRHDSMQALDYEGDVFADGVDVEGIVIRSEENRRLHVALAQVKPEQKALVQAVIFRDVTVGAYATQEGVDHSAISHRLRTVYKNLRKIYGTRAEQA